MCSVFRAAREDEGCECSERSGIQLDTAESASSRVERWLGGKNAWSASRAAHERRLEDEEDANHDAGEHVLVEQRHLPREDPRLPEIARDCPRLPRQRHVGNHWDGARDGHLVRGAGEHDRACVRKTPSRYGEIWGDVGRDGERWGDMGSPTLAAPALRAEYVLRAGRRHRAVYSEQFANAEGYEYSGIRPNTAEHASLRARRRRAVYSEHRVSPRGYECS